MIFHHLLFWAISFHICYELESIKNLGYKYSFKVNKIRIRKIRPNSHGIQLISIPNSILQEYFIGKYFDGSKVSDFNSVGGLLSGVHYNGIESIKNAKSGEQILNGEGSYIFFLGPLGKSVQKDYRFAFGRKVCFLDSGEG